VKGFLQTAASVVALVVVLSAIGLGIEWFRRRSVSKWAQEQGGSFEAGGILHGVAVPEAVPFDSGMKEVTYSNVSRIARPEASYVVAQYHATWKDFRNEMKSFSCVVCFVTLPKTDLPAAHVSYPKRPIPLGSLLGVPTPPPALPVPDAAPAFAERFEVRPLPDAGQIPPEAVARLVPRAVQDVLVAHESLLSGLLVRGNVVRVSGVGEEYRYSHKEVFDAATRLAAAWTATR
jgi:hypothetical protein